MKSSKTETFSMIGNLKEGNNCLIMYEILPMKTTVISELVEATIQKFVDKRIKLVISIEIEEVEL